MKRITLMLVVLFTAYLAASCGDDEDGGGSGGGDDPLAIIGSYTDSFGTTYEITAETFTAVFLPMSEGDDPVTSVVHITAYDNDAQFIVGQNDTEFSYYPDTWARYDWFWDNADLYYCQIEYGAEDEETAASNGTADNLDLSEGCGGFPWTNLLTPQ